MNVAIIKYNAGNIYSVDYALKRLGITPVITADPELIRKADKTPSIFYTKFFSVVTRQNGTDDLCRAQTLLLFDTHLQEI